MVRVVDVTAQNIQVRDKRLRIVRLAKVVFGDEFIVSDDVPNLISIRLKGGRDSIADVSDGSTPTVSVYTPSYFHQARCLAEGYEKEVGTEVELKQDYSRERQFQ